MSLKPLRRHDSSSFIKKKSVKFDGSRNRYIQAPPIQEDFDPFCVYYSKAEHKQSNDEVKAAVRKMIKTACPESESFTSRGLEGRTPDGSRRKSKLRRQAKQAVLEELFRQEDESKYYYDESKYDADLLAEVYKRSTAQCLRQAQRIATQDAAVARAISRETEDVCTMSMDDSYNMMEYYHTASETDSIWSDMMLVSSRDDKLSVVSDDYYDWLRKRVLAREQEVFRANQQPPRLIAQEE
jgi:hypothetical protein